MAHNWQDATNKQRDTAWAQFDHWSWQQLGKPGQYCHPNDIVVYLESSYLRQHGRQTAADGTNCPAPSTVGTPQHPFSAAGLLWALGLAGLQWEPLQQYGGTHLQRG
jgi:hypothetical protein